MSRLERLREWGQTMVEFALLLPVLLLIVFGIFEFGRAFYAYSTVANAAREAARFGIVDPTNTSGIQDAAISHATALGLTSSDVVIQCPDGACTVGNRISVTVNYTFSAVVPLIPSFALSGAATMRIESQ
ncbi:MAG: pilus assembly protein [Chloroflexi bacterium]|nr:pilus assembly protein [Chloroflexota bacterium]MBI3732201.1 pilus assembly protein [Chloroflexota bacterium]